MSVSKNWEALAINGITGFEIIVTGEANVGMLDVMPALEERIPQGINPSIWQLNLLNAGDANPEIFKPVQKNKKLNSIDRYEIVEIFSNNTSIEKIKITN